jgi:hypothetical protein
LSSAPRRRASSVPSTSTSTSSSSALLQLVSKLTSSARLRPAARQLRRRTSSPTHAMSTSVPKGASFGSQKPRDQLLNQVPVRIKLALFCSPLIDSCGAAHTLVFLFISASPGALVQERPRLLLSQQSKPSLVVDLLILIPRDPSSILREGKIHNFYTSLFVVQLTSGPTRQRLWQPLPSQPPSQRPRQLRVPWVSLCG